MPGLSRIFGLLVKPMQTEFDWSRGAVTSAAFVNLVVYAVSLLVTGRLYDRWGPKWVIAGSAVLVTLGFALMATVDSLWQFLLYYGVLAAAGFGGTSIALFGSIMGRWFEERRGLAVSLALAGFFVGQFVLIPSALQAPSPIDGWRSTCLVDSRHHAGSQPRTHVRGDTRRPRQIEGAALRQRTRGLCGRRPARGIEPRRSVAAPPIADLSLAQAMRTRSLWLFTVVMFVCGAGDYLLINHLVAMVYRPRRL